MKIDSHVHIQAYDVEKMETFADIHKEKYQKEGIGKVVFIESLEVCRKAIEVYGDFIIPVAVINMEQATYADIENCKRHGMKGIKFIAAQHPYGDKLYHELYRAVDDIDMCAVFHTGFLRRRSVANEITYMENMRAAQIDIIAQLYPNLRILMAHCSNPWWEEAWKIAFSNKNVYFDLSGGTCLLRDMSTWRAMFAPNGEICKHSISKLCFGSDTRYFSKNRNVESMAHITFYKKMFDAIDLPQEEQGNVWSHNLEKVFKLTNSK